MMRMIIADESRARQPQLRIKGVAVWLAAEELLQGRHLVLAAAALEDRVAVPAAFFPVHWVLLEH